MMRNTMNKIRSKGVCFFCLKPQQGKARNEGSKPSEEERGERKGIELKGEISDKQTPPLLTQK